MGLPGWAEFIGAVASAGIVTTLLTIWFNGRAEKAKRKREAAYLALRLSVQLEEYAAICLEQVDRHHAYRSSHGDVGELLDGIPEIGVYPGEAEGGWLSIPAKLVSRTLAVPTMIKVRNREMTLAYLNRQERPEQQEINLTLECGLVAAMLAKDLRTEFGLPSSAWNDQQISWITVAMA